MATRRHGEASRQKGMGARAVGFGDYARSETGNSLLTSNRARSRALETFELRYLEMVYADRSDHFPRHDDRIIIRFPRVLKKPDGACRLTLLQRARSRSSGNIERASDEPHAGIDPSAAKRRCRTQ